MTFTSNNLTTPVKKASSKLWLYLCTCRLPFLLEVLGLGPKQVFPVSDLISSPRKLLLDLNAKVQAGQAQAARLATTLSA